MPHEDMPGESWLTKELFAIAIVGAMLGLNGVLLWDNKEADEQLRQLQRDVGILEVEVQNNDKELSTLFNLFINDPLHETTGSF
jgi:hypothetical protein